MLGLPPQSSRVWSLVCLEHLFWRVVVFLMGAFVFVFYISFIFSLLSFSLKTIFLSVSASISLSPIHSPVSPVNKKDRKIYIAHFISFIYQVSIYLP